MAFTTFGKPAAAGNNGKNSPGVLKSGKGVKTSGARGGVLKKPTGCKGCSGGR